MSLSIEWEDYIRKSQRHYKELDALSFNKLHPKTLHSVNVVKIFFY